LISFPEPTLANSLGSFSKTESILSQTEPFHFLKPVSIQAEIEKLAANNQQGFTDKQWNHLVKSVKSGSKETNKVLNLLADKQQTPTLEDFMRIWKPYMTELAKNRPENAKLEWSPFINPNFEITQNMFSHSFAEKVGKRCIESEFWEPLACLIQARAINFRMFPELPNHLITHRKIDFILASLETVEEISPVLIVRCLQFFISEMKPRELAHYFNEKGSENEDPIKLLLNIFVCLPLNRPHMKSALRTLVTKEIEVITKYLLDWLTFYSQNFKQGGLRVPRLKNILEWSMTMIDSHVAQFILIDQLSDLLIELDTAVKAHLKICETLASLYGATETGLVPRPAQNCSFEPFSSIPE